MCVHRCSHPPLTRRCIQLVLAARYSFGISAALRIHALSNIYLLIFLRLLVGEASGFVSATSWWFSFTTLLYYLRILIRIMVEIATRRTIVVSDAVASIRFHQSLIPQSDAYVSTTIWQQFPSSPNDKAMMLTL